MRTYERSGITIDQCTECRGVYLDRGELERLVSAEHAFYGGVPPEPALSGIPQYPGGRPVPPPQPVYPSPAWGSASSPDSPSRYGYGYGTLPEPRERRPRSFLETFLD